MNTDIFRLRGPSNQMNRRLLFAPLLVFLAAGSLAKSKTNYNSCRRCGRIQDVLEEQEGKKEGGTGSEREGKEGGEDMNPERASEKRSLGWRRHREKERRLRDLTRGKGRTMKRRRKRQAAISLKKELPLDPLQVSYGSKSGGDDKLKLRMNFRFRIRNKGGKGEERKKEHLQPQPKAHPPIRPPLPQPQPQHPQKAQQQPQQPQQHQHQGQQHPPKQPPFKGPIDTKLAFATSMRPVPTEDPIPGTHKQRMHVGNEYAPPGASSEEGDNYIDSEEERQEGGGKKGKESVADEMEEEEEDGGVETVEDLMLGGGVLEHHHPKKAGGQVASFTGKSGTQKTKEAAGKKYDDGMRTGPGEEEEDDSYEDYEEEDELGGDLDGDDEDYEDDEYEDEVREDDEDQKERKEGRGKGKDGEVEEEELENMVKENTGKKKDEHRLTKEVPWQYFITRRSSPHFCPAVAINRRFLLTSQSCVSAFSSASSPDAPLLVYPSLPSASVRERVGDGPEVPRVKRMTAHPSFRLTEGDGGSVGDLALAKVEEADMADAGKGLAPVCLPSVSKRKRSMEGGHYVHFYWARNMSTPYEKPYVEVSTVQSREERKCQKIIKDIDEKGVDHRLCVTTMVKSPCPSAFTGGAITEYNARTSRHSVVGVFSYGEGECGGGKRRERGSGAAAVFTRVDAYLKWIVKAIREGECGAT